MSAVRLWGQAFDGVVGLREISVDVCRDIYISFYVDVVEIPVPVRPATPKSRDPHKNSIIGKRRSGATTYPKIT